MKTSICGTFTTLASNSSCGPSAPCADTAETPPGSLSSPEGACVRTCMQIFHACCCLTCDWNVSSGSEKLSFGKVIKTSTKQLRISETSQDISICHRALQATMWQVPLWACVCVCVLYLLTHVFMCLTPAGYYSVSLSVTEQSAMDICRSAIWEWARSKWVSVCVFLAQDVWHRRGFVHVPDAGGGDDLPAGPLGHAGHCPAAWEDDGGDGEELPGTFVLFFFSLSLPLFILYPPATLDKPDNCLLVPPA